jgi:cell division protein FtsB
MKMLGFILFALIVLLQYPLWLGKGSWHKVWEIDQQLISQHETNQKHHIRNAALDAEVKDLKQGSDAIEEHARNELGMIKQDEIFFQIETNRGNITPPDKHKDITPANNK